MTLAHVLTFPALLAGYTDFLYRADDPYAVTLVFHVQGKEVTWTVARSLLAEGLQAEVGVGDISVQPRESVVFINIRPNGRTTAILRYVASDVRAFLKATEQLVPIGSEDQTPAVDAALEKLLRGATS